MSIKYPYRFKGSLFWSLLWLLLPGVSSLYAQATAREVEGKLELKNEQLKIVIDPSVGGRIVEYVYQPFGEQNLCFPAQDNGGMMMDMFWQQRWPGELLKNPYEFRIVSAGPQEAVVEVSRLSTGTAANQTIEQLAGIKVTRRLSLRAGDRVLRCRISLENTTQTGRLVGYWMQNNFFLLGNREANQWYRPTIFGVDRISVNRPSDHYWYFVEAPTAGWIGVANGELNGGLMLLMDYNDLWKLYTNMGAVTTEWFYDRVAIPVGQTWTTEMAVIPTAGLSAYSYGSKDVVAQLSASPQSNELKLTHRLTQALGALTDVKLTAEVHDARGAWQLPAQSAKLPALSTQVHEVEQSFSGVKTWPVVVHVTVEGVDGQGQAVKVKYGDYIGGPAGRNLDMATLMPIYSFPRQIKQKAYLKPETIVRHSDGKHRVLYVRGMWYQHTGLDEALAKLKDVQVGIAWYDQSDTGSTLIDFPADYETLLGYDLVVLANIDAASLGLVGQEMLRDFVEAGGVVVMMGGDRTYGQAGFDNPRFVDMLPIKLGSSSDWRKLTEPAAIQSTIAKQTTNPLADAVVLYRHQLEPREDTAVLLTAGDRPLLVSRPQGRGMVVAHLGLPFGVTSAPAIGYWESESWFEHLANQLQSWLQQAESASQSTE